MSEVCRSRLSARRGQFNGADPAWQAEFSSFLFTNYNYSTKCCKIIYIYFLAWIVYFFI